MLYPQNGSRIVTVDSVTSLHPVYCQIEGGMFTARAKQRWCAEASTADRSLPAISAVGHARRRRFSRNSRSSCTIRHPSFHTSSTWLFLIMMHSLGDMLSVDGDADAAVEARIRIGWNKFRQLVPLLTNKDVSLIMRGRL